MSYHRYVVWELYVLKERDMTANAHEIRHSSFIDLPTQTVCVGVDYVISRCQKNDLVSMRTTIKVVLEQERRNYRLSSSNCIVLEVLTNSYVL